MSTISPLGHARIRLWSEDCNSQTASGKCIKMIKNATYDSSSDIRNRTFVYEQFLANTRRRPNVLIIWSTSRVCWKRCLFLENMSLEWLRNHCPVSDHDEAAVGQFGLVKPLVSPASPLCLLARLLQQQSCYVNGMVKPGNTARSARLPKESGEITRIPREMKREK